MNSFTLQSIIVSRDNGNALVNIYFEGRDAGLGCDIRFEGVSPAASGACLKRVLPILASQQIELPDMSVIISVRTTDDTPIKHDQIESIDLAVYAGLAKLFGGLKVPYENKSLLVGKLDASGNVGGEELAGIPMWVMNNRIYPKYSIMPAFPFHVSVLQGKLNKVASSLFDDYDMERDELSEKISRSFIKLISYLVTVTFGPDEKFAVPVQTDPEGSCAEIYSVLLKSIEYKDNDVVLTGDYTDVLGNENTDYAFSLMDVEWPVDALGSLYGYLVEKYL